MKKLLFSLTKKDFEIQTFRAGGKGGQHQNKTETGVRIIHRASGATGESREERSQYANKKNAFIRLAASKKFLAWHKLETARLLGHLKGVDEAVDKLMREKNLKIEYFEAP